MVSTRRTSLADSDPLLLTWKAPSLTRYGTPPNGKCYWRASANSDSPAPGSKQAQLRVPFSRALVGLIVLRGRGQTVPGAQGLKKLVQLGRVGTGTAVLPAVTPLIFLREAGKQLVEFLVKVLALPRAQAHAEPGRDETDPVIDGLFDDLGDVFWTVLDKGQDGHHQQADLDAVFGQHLGCTEAARWGRRARLDLFCQLVVGGGDGETDRSLHLVDLDQRVQVAEDEVALGGNMGRESGFGDDGQCPPGHVEFGLGGGVGILHRAGAHRADHLLAR